MLVLSLRPGLEDIVLKTSDGEIRLRPYKRDGRWCLACEMPDAVRFEKQRWKEVKCG